MAVTDLDEIQIRKYLAEEIEMATAVPRICPAPIYFTSKEDYWATIDSISLTTQQQLETTDIKFAWVFLKNFRDDPQSPQDSPIRTLIYEIGLFYEYNHRRADENISPDAFNRLMLDEHNLFIKDYLALVARFTGPRNMAFSSTGLPVLSSANYVITRTSNLQQIGDIADKLDCDFVPKVQGHQVRFNQNVIVQLREC